MLEPGLRLVARDHPLIEDLANAFHRHDFEEAHLPWAIEGQCSEVDNLVLIVSAQDDRVDLDGRESGILGCFADARRSGTILPPG